MIENPNNYQTYYDLGRQLAQEKKWRKAVKTYQQALEFQDNVAEIYHHWGDALINLQRWQQAVTVYQKAISLDDNFAWSHHNLGVALFNLGKIKKAINAYEKAIAINQKNSQFPYSLGRVLASQGSWEVAIENYQAALSLGLKSFQAYHELGDIFSEIKQWNEAIEAYQSAIKINQKSAWSYHNLGMALLNLELPQEAVSFFQQVINIDGNFVAGYYYLGEAFRLQKKWDEAVTTYRQAVKLNPDFPNLQQTLADTLQQRARADLDTAIATYDRLLANADSPGSIYHQIAVILESQQKLPQALFYLGAALKSEPGNFHYLAFYDRICQQRSQLYQLSPQLTHREADSFKIADHSYGLWCKYNTPTIADLRSFCLQVAEIADKPTVSIILPLAESAKEWIEATIASIQDQVYPHWELCLAAATVSNDSEQYWQEASQLNSILENFIKSDRRIKLSPCDNQMEMAELANTALTTATGEWIAVLQPNTLLTPHALLEFIWQLARDSPADIIYGDEDKIKQGNLIGNPWFKPEWCPDLLLARNYFGSLVFCRHSLVQEHSGFQKGYGDAYSYELWLRLTEKANQIGHIPQIIAHHQLQSGERDDEIQNQINAVTDALKRRGETAVVTSNLDFSEIKTIRYEITDRDLVSIIIPTRNLGEILDRCLTSIFELTTYDNYEAILVDNGSDEPETLAIIDRWLAKEPERIKCLRLDVPFNYSLLNNRGVAEARGKYLLFLNNDTKVITSDWLSAMLEQAQRPTIGAVGALLLYPDDTIQHAGVVLGVTEVAGHGHRNYPISDTGYNYSLIATSNYSAVTSACLMCRREVFMEVGGFNEQLAVAYNDVDFCLKLQQQGYYNIWLPHVRLYHDESQSRTPEDTPEKQQRILQEISYMKKTWTDAIAKDPCYSIHLTREEENYSLNLKCKAEIKAIFLSEVSQEQLWGFFIDSPKPGCLKRNSLDIIGWVVGRIANAISLEIICDQTMIAMTDIKENRLDVATAYPEIPEAENSGFATTIDVSDLPYEAELNLQVVLTNNTKIKLGKIQLG